MTLDEWAWAHVAIGGAATFIFLYQTFGAVVDGAVSDGTAADGTAADGNPDFGAGEDFSADTPTDGHGGLSTYLSVRNFVALFMGYGWVTLAATLSGMSREVSSFLGVCAGSVLAVLSLYMLRTFLKFQEDGTLNMESLVGKHASVYITIGGNALSAGKVMVDTEKGRIELPARTHDPEELRPGRLVTILQAEGGVLWVTLR
jgi:membrane protein implicated in regulation of membrane protease activity